MELELVPCDLCGRDSYRVRYYKPDTWLRHDLYQFPVVECDACGLVYVNPRPTPTQMGTFYPAGYHDGRDAAEFQARYRRQAALLPSLAGRRVLDVGCARGDFLSFLLDREDFEAHGVDAYAGGVADPRIRFVPAELTDAGYPDAAFDLVMAWAVFEHLHHPTAYFDECARVLVPGGRLVILVTNADSLYGRMACMEDVPRHTYHYSEATLAEYGRKCGLRLDNVLFDDSIFDGRGRGTFRLLAGRLTGFSWEKWMRGELSAISRLAMKAGTLVDLVAFGTHWEARLRRSGVMIATYEKP